MSISTVLDGIKTIVEANGYTVHTTSDEMRDKFAALLQTSVMPVYEANADRHEGGVQVTLYDKIKPKSRFSDEKDSAGRVETILTALKDSFSSWAVNLTIEGADTAIDGGFRVTELQLTVIYAV